MRAISAAHRMCAERLGCTGWMGSGFVGTPAAAIASPVDTPEQYALDVKAAAAKNLDVVRAEASKAGVPFDLILRSNEHPYEKIIKAAQDFMCDVIFQASHGRRCMSAILLGSETQKVLTHCKIPVLVSR